MAGGTRVPTITHPLKNRSSHWDPPMAAHLQPWHPWSLGSPAAPATIAVKPSAKMLEEAAWRADGKSKWPETPKKTLPDSTLS